MATPTDAGPRPPEGWDRGAHITRGRRPEPRAPDAVPPGRSRRNRVPGWTLMAPAPTVESYLHLNTIDRREPMAEGMYPAATRESLPAPNWLQRSTIREHQPRRLRRGRSSGEDQAADRGGGRPRDAMPILHHRAHQARAPQGGAPGGDHGGDLGRRRDASRRRLRPFDAGPARPGGRGRRTIRRTGRSAGPRAREKGVMTRAPEQHAVSGDGLPRQRPDVDPTRRIPACIRRTCPGRTTD